MNIFPGCSDKSELVAFLLNKFGNGMHFKHKKKVGRNYLLANIRKWRIM